VHYTREATDKISTQLNFELPEYFHFALRANSQNSSTEPDTQPAYLSPSECPHHHTSRFAWRADSVSPRALPCGRLAHICRAHPLSVTPHLVSSVVCLDYLSVCLPSSVVHRVCLPIHLCPSVCPYLLFSSRACIDRARARLPVVVVYRFGDSIFGKTPRWKGERQTILQAPEYKGTLLQKYFRDKKHVHVDADLMHTLCDSYWGRFRPEEDLVVHHRTGNQIYFDSLLECAQRHMQLRSAHNVSGAPLTARIVTIKRYSSTIDHNGDERDFHSKPVVKLMESLEELGYVGITVQSSAHVAMAAGAAALAAAESLAASSAVEEVASPSNNNAQVANVYDAQAAIDAASRTASAAAAAASAAAEAVTAASSDTDFCTLLLAKNVCLTTGGFDAAVRVIRKKRAKGGSGSQSEYNDDSGLSDDSDLSTDQEERLLATMADEEMEQEEEEGEGEETEEAEDGRLLMVEG
jgi:hypothetical protein